METLLIAPLFMHFSTYNFSRHSQVLIVLLVFMMFQRPAAITFKDFPFRNKINNPTALDRSKESLAAREAKKAISDITQEILESIAKNHGKAISILFTFGGVLDGSEGEMHLDFLSQTDSVAYEWKFLLTTDPSYMMNINNSTISNESGTVRGANGFTSVVSYVRVLSNALTAIIEMNEELYDATVDDTRATVEKMLKDMWDDKRIDALECDHDIELITDLSMREQAYEEVLRSAVSRSSQFQYTMNDDTATPESLYTHANGVRREFLRTLPNDEYLHLQWALENNSIEQIGLNIKMAWQTLEETNEPVFVGVIDTGLDTNHPDIKSNIWTNSAELWGEEGVDDDADGVVDNIHGCNFHPRGGRKPNGDVLDSVGHGTHVAGIIAGTANNSIGIAGAGRHVLLIPIKAYSVGAVAAAMNWMLSRNIRLSNNSWKFRNPSPVLRMVYVQASRRDHLAIFAAGNDYTNLDTDPRGVWPQLYSPSLSNMIVVANLQAAGTLAPNSNRGAKYVHVAAPGMNILSTYPINKRSSFKKKGYIYLSGTSMAAPFVTAIAALIYSVNPKLTHQGILPLITSSLVNEVAIKHLDGLVTYPGIIDASAVISIVHNWFEKPQLSRPNLLTAESCGNQCELGEYTCTRKNPIEVAAEALVRL